MALTSEERVARCASTRGAAEALVEDIAYLRSMPSLPEITRGELRRLSALLRRMLVERDIVAVSSPRIGRIKLRAADNRKVRRNSVLHPPIFFSTAGITIGDAEITQICVEARPRGQQRHTIQDEPAKDVFLRIDNFANQQILCLDGVWVSRSETIKYAANVASGVHSSAPKTPAEITLSELRQRFRYKITAEGMEMRTVHYRNGDDPPLSYDPDAIDPVLVEIYAAAQYIIGSPDIERLDAMIKEELFE